MLMVRRYLYIETTPESKHFIVESNPITAMGEEPNGTVLGKHTDQKTLMLF